MKYQDYYFESISKIRKSQKLSLNFENLRSVNERKESLSETEFIILINFAENNEIQVNHWVNDQVTMHQFVSYFKNQNSEVYRHSIFILSDYLNCNTSVVHAFQTEPKKYKSYN